MLLSTISCRLCRQLEIRCCCRLNHGPELEQTGGGLVRDDCLRGEVAFEFDSFLSHCDCPTSNMKGGGVGVQTAPRFPLPYMYPACSHSHTLQKEDHARFSPSSKLVRWV